MELAHQTHKASKAAVEDVINSMPENVITQILDCLPIKDAVRTGILSRSWRFKWTMISQLVFDFEFFKPGSDDRNNCNERTITRLLHHLKGPVAKFALIPKYKLLDIEDVSLWFMVLSRRGIKELRVLNHHRTPLKLPTYLFGCQDLKTLRLGNCCFHMAPGFCGFPNLLDLGFSMIIFESGNIGEFITGCPLLKFLRFGYNYSTSKLEQNAIKKLKHLKTLYLQLGDLENIAITSSGIYELVGSLPKLQGMSLDFRNCKLVAEASAGKQPPTAFPHFKTLTLKGIDFGSIIMLSFARDLIWVSKQLLTLDITARYYDVVPPPLFETLEADYSRMQKLNLRSVVFSCFRGSENEVCLIKYILACSPSLKKIAIHANSSQVFGGENGRVMFATKLLKFHRASTIAEVDINWI